MYRLLIIDDESHIINRIQNCINWEQLNIEIIGDASNGLDGLNIAMEQHPDIVICDIRMPLMDGISFATEYQHHYPHSQIIFLSGYSDKTYMQNAIRLNAVDYLFKPYELSDLLSAIEKAISHLKQQSFAQELQHNDDLLPELLYQADSIANLMDFLRKHPLKVDFLKPFVCILIRFNSGVSFSQYTQGNIPDTLEVQRLITSYYSDFEDILSCIFFDRYVMSKTGNNYLVYANVPEKDCLPPEILHRLSALLGLVTETSIAVGISPLFDSYDSIKTALHLARENVLSGFLVGFQKILITPPSRDFSSEHESRRQFIASLEKRDISGASNSLNDYFTYISNCAPKYIPAIQEDLLQISIFLKEELKTPPFQPVSKFINLAASLEDIRQYMQNLLSQYFFELDTMDNYGRIIFETEQYILQHLEDSLSVKQIADSVFISPTYLCFLYKKKTGKTLKQFILDARMQKAKRLLLDTHEKIGDIALSLGYANQNYFTKIFVSYYGKTPSSFRKRAD